MRRLAAIVALAAPLHAFALGICDSKEKFDALYRAITPFRGALIEKRFDELDRVYNGVLADVRKGRLSDQEAHRWFYAAFATSNVAAEPLHHEWLARYPDSQAARLAAAYHFWSRGWASRGRGYASDTTVSQFASMRSEFTKSLALLEAAEARGPKSSLAAGLRIDMLASGGGSRRQVVSIYQNALHDFPRSIEVRVFYVEKSPPKWGGSIEELLAIRKDAESLPADDRRYVAYLVYSEVAAAYNLEKRFDKADEYYRRGIPLCPGLDGALESAIALHKERRDFDALIPLLDELIRRQPHKGGNYATRGWAYGEKKEWARSFADYEKAASYGSAQGFSGMAWHYEMGRVVKPDYARSVELYEMAYARGDKTARQRADNVRKGAGIK